MAKSSLRKRFDLGNVFTHKKSRQTGTKSDIDVQELQKDSENEILISSDYNF